ncbi:hypothetical protein CIT292_08692 [Citrobacter youngae ATCC 29220]|uniref:Uncharacterized protein n=1 Tax=Citrobacter youngae ATCC 29220 TaxID=500640 RepID=D4BDX3_9ENTR|nr:hypothetical protein CIT292_08692 [Citrobacter youngae ATCC 29220]
MYKIKQKHHKNQKHKINLRFFKMSFNLFLMINSPPEKITTQEEYSCI